MSILGLAAAVVSAIAPDFLRNLRRKDIGENYAKRVVDFIGENIKPLKTEDDVAEVVQIIRQDPVKFENLMQMLLDAERELVEMYISDVQHARATNRSIDDSWQPFVLLLLSFGSLLLISVFIVWMVIRPPYFETNAANKELVIQIAGAAIGFLTGIGGMFARNIGSAFDFWFGSSAGSKDKSGQIDNLVQQIEKSSARFAGTDETTQTVVSSGQVTEHQQDGLAARLSDFRNLMKQSG